MRKFTISSYFEMIKMEDKVYRNKFAVKAAIGMLRVAKKAAKVDTKEELAKLKPEAEQFKASKEYQTLLDEQKKRDDDDEFKGELDPYGYELYEKFVSASSVDLGIALRPSEQGTRIRNTGCQVQS